MTTLPPVLETLRSASLNELHAVSFDGIVTHLSMAGIAAIASDLEQEWADQANSAQFRMVLLRVLARLSVFNSLSGNPVRSEFWAAVSKSDSALDRRVALLACNLSKDEGLWQLLARSWRSDAESRNRALALELMGTTGRTDPQRRARTIGEYREAIGGRDAMAKVGALHGSLLVSEQSAEDIPRRVIGEEKNGHLVALAFTVLLARNRRRGQTLYRAILSYAMTHRPDPQVAGMLLSVCALCDPAATRRLRATLLEAPAVPDFESLRAGALYLLEHGVPQGRIPRGVATAFGEWPATSA